MLSAPNLKGAFVKYEISEVTKIDLFAEQKQTSITAKIILCIILSFEADPFLTCWLLLDLFHGVDMDSDGLLAPSSGHYNKPNLYFPGS